jgi:mannosyltransferase OCH1-like enzyme
VVKKIHLIWIGSKVPSSEARPYKQRIMKWCALNPDYTVNVWIAGKKLNAAQRADMDDLFVMTIHNNLRVRDVSDKNVLLGLNDLFSQEVFTKYPNYGAASDILRCAILIKEGGAYFDTDIIPVKALGGLEPPNKVLLHQVAMTWSNDALYATEVGTPFFLKYRELMVKRYKEAPKQELQARRTDRDLKNTTTQNYTGPGALQDVVVEMGWQDERTWPAITIPDDRIAQPENGSDCSWL